MFNKTPFLIIIVKDAQYVNKILKTPINYFYWEFSYVDIFPIKQEVVVEHVTGFVLF